MRFIMNHEKKNKKYILHNFLIFVFWILIWQLASMLIGQELLFASPVSVLLSLNQMIKRYNFWLSIGTTLYKIGIGFLLGFLSGCMLGMISHFQNWFKILLNPIIALMKSMPIASFVVIILVWMGSKNLSIVISYFVVFPMIYLSILEGFHSVPKEMIELSIIFQISYFKKIVYIYGIYAYPSLISASKIALGMCWKAGVAGEMIGTPKNSIGEHLYLSKLYLSTSEVFAWTIVILLISYAFEKIVLYLLDRLSKKRWRL